MQSGDKIVNLTVATSEHWTDKASGERKEKTEWHRVVVFNDRIATVCEKYVRKGMKLYIEGQLQTRKWTDQSGNERYSTEIVIGRFNGKMEMLSKPTDPAEEMRSAATPPPTSTGTRAPNRRETAQRDLDDEIPF